MVVNVDGEGLAAFQNNGGRLQRGMICTRRRDKSAGRANPRNPSTTLLNGGHQCRAALLLGSPSWIREVEARSLEAAPAHADKEPTAH